MKTPIYNQKGKKVNSVDLPESIFGLSLNHDLVNEVIKTIRFNKRQKRAHTKDRSERQGGGRKPWPQKGTGRARHGSRRSPIWRKGGVTFGPRKEKKISKKINRKMKRKALLQALSSKVQDNELRIIGQIKADKTKQMAQILRNLDIKKSTLVVGNKGEIERVLSNIPNTKYARAKDLNALDLLSYKYLLVTKNGLKKLRQRL